MNWTLKGILMLYVHILKEWLMGLWKKIVDFVRWILAQL